jgi:2-dehydro-3-deoxygalactonokinase
MPQPAFLAADWGTSNLRAWVIGGDGQVLAEERFPGGVAKIAAGATSALLRDEIRPRLKAENLPAVICGMIGSTLGMVEVPYVQCPAGLEDVSAHLFRVAGETPQVVIAPGLRCLRLSGDPDVMRGEETKILGWVSLDPARAHGRQVLCLPGTHTKWVLVEDGRIVRFVTAMSGELFDVLTHHGVLKTGDDAVDDPDAFAQGIARGAEPGSLAAKLFTARSRVVGGDMAKASARSYLSGLLIGDEVANLPAMLGADPQAEIGLLGDPELCRHYGAAFGQTGLTCHAHDGDQAVLAGLRALYESRVSHDPR